MTVDTIQPDALKLAADIKNQFENDDIPLTILDSMVSLCVAFAISPEDLFFKWDAYSTTLENTPDLPSLKDLEMLKSQIQKEQEKQITASLSLGKNMSFLQPKLIKQEQINASNIDNLLKNGPSAIPLKSNVRPKLVPRDMNSATPQTPIGKSQRSFSELSSPAFGASAFSPLTKPFKISSPSIHASNFADRINRGNKELVFNEHISYEKVSPNTPSIAEISLVPGQQTSGYRYMYEKLTEKGELLDERINHFAKNLADQYHAEKLNQNDEMMKDDDDDELDDPMKLIAHPAHPTSSDIFTVGRVCCDSTEESVRLNDQSVMLESSKDIGGGTRVKLNLSLLLENQTPFHLFPGQIIGVEANNPSGRVLNVSKIYYPQLPSVPATNVSEIAEFYRKDSNHPRPVNVITASGPYTLEDSLNYEPLEAFTEVIERDPPDAVIMMGPFVDIDHPMIANGDVDMDIPDLFKFHVTSRIERMLQARPSLKVILIPSTRDATTEWVAFPQPPIAVGLSEAETLLRRAELGLDLENVYLFPNPVQFTVNEILFSVSTTDSLFHLNMSDCCFKGSGKDALDRISQNFHYILGQRSFYPLFPPHRGAYLDSARALACANDQGEDSGPLTLQARPDVLIIPSKLKHATKLVEGSLCVNPNSLTLGRSGGTFVRLCIHPFDLPAVIEDDVVLEHSVGQRALVETIRV